MGFEEGWPKRGAVNRPAGGSETWEEVDGDGLARTSRDWRRVAGGAGRGPFLAWLSAGPPVEEMEVVRGVLAAEARGRSSLALRLGGCWTGCEDDEGDEVVAVAVPPSPVIWASRSPIYQKRPPKGMSANDPHLLKSIKRLTILDTKSKKQKADRMTSFGGEAERRSAVRDCARARSRPRSGHRSAKRRAGERI